MIPGKPDNHKIPIKEVISVWYLKTVDTKGDLYLEDDKRRILRRYDFKSLVSAEVQAILDRAASTAPPWYDKSHASLIKLFAKMAGV